MPNFLTSHALEIVRVLAFSSLFGLLLAIGLETSFKALLAALQRVPLLPLMLGNFLLIPIVATTLVIQMDLEQNAAMALVLLACAPFAPVVPLFVRMAHGHLALATGLTALFPAFSAMLTPCAVTLSFWFLHAQGHAIPSSSLILELLAASITLPLILGMILRERLPELSTQIQKPLEWLSEAIGVLSLSYLASLETGHLAAFRFDGTWPYVLFYEASFCIGLALGQGPWVHRVVMGFGTANRNIGLAILLAAAMADDPDLLGEVLTQSLLMLALGLLHVALIRIGSTCGRCRDGVGSDKTPRR